MTNYVLTEGRRPEFDARDGEILAANLEAWNARGGPRVGDWCKMPDGKMCRFTHDWGEDIQTTSRYYPGHGSFFFGRGYMDYSGGLDPAILKSRLIDTGETKPGAAWFFHHNEARASNGVYFNVDCRVFEVTA